MLGDCYTCAVVEHLSKDELMGYDVVNTTHNFTPNHVSTNTRNNLVPELIVVSVEDDKKPEKSLD